MSLVTYDAPPNGRPSSLEVMDRGMELAERISNTDFVPRALRGNTPAILAAILYGHEIGLEPMRSLAMIAVIDGKPSVAAEAQRSLILAAGHEIWPDESTVTKAVYAGRRRDSKQIVRVTWTLDDAKRARIAGKPNWQAYPRQMLLARASAELARQVFADVIGGLVATEELDDVVDVEPIVETDGEDETKAKPKTTTRRRRSRPAPAPAPEPEAEAADEAEAQATPPPEPDATPDTITEAQLTKLMVLFGEKGLGDRGARLEYTGNVVGRPIGSTKDLTALEASRVIEALDALPQKQAEGGLPADEQALFDEAQERFDATEVVEQISSDQRNRINALFRERGIDERRERLAYAAKVVGREVPSSTDLTAAEAVKLIGALERGDDPDSF